MKNQIILKVKHLINEFVANGKIIPESWKPWIHLIELFLRIAKWFTPDDIDVIIDEIIAAIDLVEESNIPLKARIAKNVNSLSEEYKLAGNLIPESWKPWLGLIKLFLKVARLFTPDNIDVIIDELLEAIKLVEEAK